MNNIRYSHFIRGNVDKLILTNVGQKIRKNYKKREREREKERKQNHETTD